MIRPGTSPAKLTLGAAVIMGTAFLFFLRTPLAPLDAPESRLETPGTVILDSQGVVLQRDVKVGLRLPVTLDQAAPVVLKATITAEDRRFWLHPGVDPIAIARALLHWPEGPSGASTITQQLARRLYLRQNPGPPLLRKSREVLLALQLEARYSKKEILTFYLNEVYYGRHAYGIEAAARTYFSTSARDLDLAQAALLAGLPQLPSAYDPVVDPAPAKRRQAYVLERMIAAGYISRLQAEEAKSEPLYLVQDVAPPIAPHFVAYALAELERLRPDLEGKPGLLIETTLNAGLQQGAERILRLRLEEVRDRGAGNGALVVLDPNTGHILAMIGSVDFFDEENAGQINMALEARQPGSALKPFLYAAALERGFTPATPLLDIPTTFRTSSWPYTPWNYNRRFHGIVPLRVALASSFNVPAVRTLEQVGIDAFLEIAHRLGLRTLTETEVYGLALALGGGEVRLLDLTAAYGAIATGGLLVKPVAITRVRDTSGRVLYTAESAPVRRVLAPEHAYLLADILSDPAARTPGFGEVNPLSMPVRAGVKTGTTTGPRDNWTVGFTPDRVVGVWVGNADSRPMANVSGVDGAGPIWRDVIAVALRDIAARWLAKPPGLLEETVCSPAGLVPGSHCPASVNELFVSGTVPTTSESYYLRDHEGYLMTNPTTEARSWAQDAGIRLTDTPAVDTEAKVFVVQPPPESVFFLSPELPAQELMLRAAVPAGAREVEFWVDSELVGRAAPSRPWMVWRLDPGVHRLEVVALLADGTTASSSVIYEGKT